MSLLDTASLIVTPNGYKEGKLYSVIPSDGSGDLSVTRATTATRVNSAGLVELVPYNLVTYSEQFNNAAWVPIFSTITANTTTAPNGTLTADTIVGTTNASSPSVSNGSKLYYNSGTNPTIIASNNTVTGSVYIYAATAITVQLFIYEWGGSESGQSYTLIPNTWQRIEFTKTFVGGGSGNVGLAIQVNANTAYIWGAQLVEGSTAKDYQKTETRLNIPRLDYSNGTCPSLLVEPQRTNAVTYSEFFSTANGYNYQNASQSGSSIVSPSGLLAYGITSTTSANDFHRYYKTLGGRSGVNTTTIFAKKGTSRYLGLGVNQNGSTGNNNVVVFDLQNGVIASNIYGVTASIEDFGNDWYRLVHTFDYGTGGTYADICVHNTGTSTYTINAFQTFDSPSSPTTIYVWGLQMEAGSYATSYIPTTSASVTRNADVISKTGISSLIGQTEGVIFYDFILSTTGVDFTLANLYSSSNANSYSLFYINPSNQIGVSVINNGSTECEIIVPTLALGRHRIAFAYKQNDFVVYVDGVQIGTDTNGTIPTMDNFNLIGFNLAPSAYRQEVNIYAAALWPTRLTNTQLAQLTTI